MLNRFSFFLNHKYARHIKNTAWLLIEKSLRILDAFFIGIWLARYLGPEQFGLLSYAESMVYLFAVIAALGLDQIVVRELVKNESQRDLILGTTLALRIAGFALMIICLSTTLRFLNNDSFTNTIVLIIAFSVFFRSFLGIDFYFQSRIESKYIVITNSLAIGMVAIIKAVLIFTNAQLVSFAYTYAVETFFIAIGLLANYFHKGLSISKWKVSLPMAVFFLKKSFFLLIGSIATIIYFKIDQIMIKEIIGNKAVGYYSVAVKLTSISLFITVSITQSVFPSLVELREKNREQFLKRLQQLYDILMKIAIVVSILYTIFAKDIVTILFGNEYFESIEIVVIYVWSIVFVFLNNGSWSYYLNEGLEKLSSIRLIIGAVVNIVLNMYFIESFGLAGAAYATLISYSLTGYFINYLFKQTRTNFYLQTNSILNLFNFKTWIKPL